MRRLCLLLSGILAILRPGIAGDSLAGSDVLPIEPVDIGTAPQFVFDNYIVDNHWALKYKREAVERRFHQPRKFAGNPVIRGDGGYVTVLREERTGLFRMWYQTAVIGDPKRGVRTLYAVAYAESRDGIAWTFPKLHLHEWKGTEENNIVWRGIDGRRASGQFFLQVPERDRRGFRHVMMYSGTGGIHLVGSEDGIHWDKASDTTIAAFHSDTNNSVVYDPRRKEYVMYCRAKHIYRTFRGEVIDTGASRRIARMSSKELWSRWDAEPQNILIPDELDAEKNFNFFYGMPTRLADGIYWGFLWPFKMNTDIHTELAWSRDGFHFERLPGRPKLIDRGPEGSWDDGMVFGGYQWVEVGDEWWMYYAGWDGPHKPPPGESRTPGIGLVKLRKEGFISMHGPHGGGVISTRRLRWPGGALLVNANARQGELKVRVTDARRKVLPGFDYKSCVGLTENSVSHEVRWKNESIASLAGRVIRLEFFLKDADLYTFRSQSRKKSRNR